MRKLASRILAVALAALLFSGCSRTHQARSAVPSGFLSNYSQLSPGESDQALLRYVKPGVAWKQYDSILLEPVRVYAGKKSSLGKAEPEERQALAEYFYSELYEELKKDYKMASTTGPGVLAIRTAITDADESMVLLNTVTTIMPIGLAVSTLKRVVVGSHSFVGEAQAEMEITDSVSGVRLAAFVDKRSGTKALRSKFGAWNDAKAAFDYWAEQLRDGLAEQRSAKD